MQRLGARVVRDSFLVLSLCGLFACADAPDDPDELDICFPGGKCDSFDHGGVAYTQDRAADVLAGYNPITDRVTSPCVTPVGEPSYIAGQSSETLDLVYVDNRSMITQETSDALGLNLNFLFFEAAGAFELLRSVSTKSTSINLMVRMTADYWVMNRRRLTFDDRAAEKLAMGIGPFVKACGSHYAQGVRYGGHVYALITLDSSDTSTKESLKTSLGLSLLGVVPLTPTLAHKVSTAASRQNVSVTVRFAADGFILDGRPASAPILSTLLGQGIGPDFFQMLDRIREQLEQSVNLDKCRDAGVGTCDGAPAAGYADNTLRNSRPTGILAGYYDRLDNGAPSGTEARYEELYQRVENTESYLDALSALQERIDRVYREETGKTLNASATILTFSQVAPPGTPVFRPSQLVALAEKWHAVFAPGGPTRQPIQDALKTCHTASVDLSDCTGGIPVGETPAAKAATQELSSYASTGRILHIRTWQGGAADDVEFSTAAWKCADGGGRLPTDAEARFLNLLVSSSFMQDHRIWVSSNRCGGSGNPAFAADLVQGTAAICVPNAIFADDDLGLICVPLDGPFQNAPPP